MTRIPADPGRRLWLRFFPSPVLDHFAARFGTCPPFEFCAVQHLEREMEVTSVFFFFMSQSYGGNYARGAICVVVRTNV